MEYSAPITQRLHMKLSSKELGRIRPAILDYLADTGQKPEEVTLGIDFVKVLLPYLQETCSTYAGITNKDLNTTNVAIKQLDANVRAPFNHIKKLRDDLDALLTLRQDNEDVIDNVLPPPAFKEPHPKQTQADVPPIPQKHLQQRNVGSKVTRS